MTDPLITVDRMKQVVRDISALVRQDLLVGIPGETTERKSGPSEPKAMNNATLGYIHEFGSPAANIPARPFLMPGIEEAQDKIEARLRKAAQVALEGRGDQAIVDALAVVGLVAQAAVKDKINSGDFAPLSDTTLRLRAAKGRKGAQDELDSRAAGNAPGTADAKPLIDTGQLRNSINFVIREK